jgi:hypothetical protein
VQARTCSIAGDYAGHRCPGTSLLAEELDNLRIQWQTVPLVRFTKVDRQGLCLALQGFSKVAVKIKAAKQEPRPGERQSAGFDEQR